MSDTSQPTAPPPAAPPAAAPPAAPPVPAQAEVPVQAPVDQPRPLGEQAPPKPEGQESNKQSHISRREALANAFKRAQEAQEEAVKSPPKREQPAKAKVPDKKADLEGQQTKSERYREAGKFAKDPSKLQPEGGDKSASPAEAGDRSASVPQQQIKPLDEKAPYREPPGRWSDRAKQEWHAAPESVRGAVYQMAKEFQGAYQKYKADVDIMDELRPYHELATKQGTTLRRAFDSYYNIEGKLRQDLIGGLDVIVQNVARGQGLVGRHGGQLTLRDVCEHVLSMSPEQHQLTQQRNYQTASEQQLGQLHQKIARQDQMLNQILYQQKVTYTRSQVDQFADAHPRFDELSDLIKTELDHGYTLEVAYARADRLRPSTHAVQTRTQSAQTRKTSISGAPDGKAGNTRLSDRQRQTNGEAKHPTRRESLEKAFRRVSNGV